MFKSIIAWCLGIDKNKLYTYTYKNQPREVGYIYGSREENITEMIKLHLEYEGRDICLNYGFKLRVYNKYVPYRFYENLEVTHTGVVIFTVTTQRYGEGMEKYQVRSIKVLKPEFYELVEVFEQAVKEKLAELIELDKTRRECNLSVIKNNISKSN